MLSAASTNTTDLLLQGGAIGLLAALGRYLIQRGDTRESAALIAYAKALKEKDTKIEALTSRVATLEATCADCMARLEMHTKQLPKE